MDGYLRDLYESIKDKTRFVQPYWQEISNSLADELDPENFLAQRQVLDTMNPLACSVYELEIFERSGLSALIEEPMTFGQVPYYGKYSANFVRQVSHVLNYEEYEEKPLCALGETAVEWGGGYGLQAFIIHKYYGPDQYTIIDLPIFTVIQYHFLSRALGEHMVSVNGDTPIVLVPVGDCDKVQDADTFISTWALSESSEEALNYVAERDYFGAWHGNILTAFQTNDDKFPFAQNLGFDLSVYPIEYIPGNYYGFC